MHNYIPPIKYSHKTRMGNWSEEWELEEVKRKDYMKNKQMEKTGGNRRQRELMNSYQSASLTYSKDGFYHFGDKVMLYNGKTLGFLAADIYTEQSKTEEIYSVSTVKDIHACARSVFILERANPKDGYRDNLVHYGQQIRLRINPLLLNKDVFLHSEPTSTVKYSQVSRNQEVTFCLKQNYNVVWSFQNPNPNVRFESEGEPIRVEDNVLLKHNMTNQWLASDNKTIKNSYGQNEYEVMVKNFLVNSKSQNLVQQKTGQTTIDFPARSQTNENLWLMVNAADPSQQFDETVTKMVYAKGPLLQKIRYHLTQKGIFGVRFLSKVYKNMDVNKLKKLDVDDFRWGLHAAKIFLNEQEMDVLFNEYTVKGEKDMVDYVKFLDEIRGKVQQKRKVMIETAWKTVKKILNENITLEQIAKIFDAERHPQVYTKVKTPKEVFSEFVSSWDNIKPDYKVSWEEFLDYFSDISAIIPKDDHFQFLMVSCFHM